MGGTKEVPAQLAACMYQGLWFPRCVAGVIIPYMAVKGVIGPHVVKGGHLWFRVAATLLGIGIVKRCNWWCMFAGRLRAPGASKVLCSGMIYRAFPGGPAGIGLGRSVECVHGPTTIYQI